MPLRKVVGLTEVPYDRWPDGQPKTYTAYALECGHSRPVAGGNSKRRGQASVPFAMPVGQNFNCTKCPKEP